MDLATASTAVQKIDIQTEYLHDHSFVKELLTDYISIAEYKPLKIGDKISSSYIGHCLLARFHELYEYCAKTKSLPFCLSMFWIKISGESLKCEHEFPGDIKTVEIALKESLPSDHFIKIILSIIHQNPIDNYSRNLRAIISRCVEDQENLACLD